MSREIDLLESLRDDAEALQFRDEEQRDACVRRTEMLARRVFGEDSKYIEELGKIRFHPVVYTSQMTAEDYRPSWNSGKAKLVNLINTMIEEITVFGIEEETDSEDQGDAAEHIMERSVFIVHGHDEEMKQSAARTLEHLGLSALVLHEQPSQGRTIIEKFMDYGQVSSFAVILLSPDDLAYASDEGPDRARFRARQNVILELGFFLGKLGRSRVVVIHREAEQFEMPSDYSGVLFVPYDRRGIWRFELVRELKAAGYEVDANALL